VIPPPEDTRSLVVETECVSDPLYVLCTVCTVLAVDVRGRLALTGVCVAMTDLVIGTLLADAFGHFGAA
jgi:hypothetical protein